MFQFRSKYCPIKINDNYIPSTTEKHPHVEIMDKIFPPLKKVSVLYLSSPSGTKTLAWSSEQKKGHLYHLYLPLKQVPKLLDFNTSF